MRGEEFRGRVRGESGEGDCREGGGVRAGVDGGDSLGDLDGAKAGQRESEPREREGEERRTASYAARGMPIVFPPLPIGPLFPVGAGPILFNRPPSPP